MLAVENGMYASCMHAFSFGATFLVFSFSRNIVGLEFIICHIGICPTLANVGGFETMTSLGGKAKFKSQKSFTCMKTWTVCPVRCMLRHCSLSAGRLMCYLYCCSRSC